MNQKYKVYIHWTWGSRLGSFSEREEYVTEDVSEEALAVALAQTAERLKTRYCFDCGRVDYPLYPSINYIEIVPVGQKQTVCEGAMLDQANKVFRDYETQQKEKR